MSINLNPEQETKSVLFLVLGLMIREIYNFIAKGGLSGQYPLFESLFFIIIGIVTLAMLLIPSVRRFIERLNFLEKTVERILKSLKRDENSD
jgi:hypothetical protein